MTVPSLDLPFGCAEPVTADSARPQFPLSD
jgi:hypothetical protein